MAGANFFLKMVIKEILEKEKNNSSYCYLYKEGLFWRAYEKSAMIFVNNIRKYALIKKFYKNVGNEIVYLGFPGLAQDHWGGAKAQKR